MPTNEAGKMSGAEAAAVGVSDADKALVSDATYDCYPRAFPFPTVSLLSCRLWQADFIHFCT